MPYQGNTPVESYIATVKDSFNGNGSTTAFTMSKPTQVNDVRVVVENVIQDPSVAYTVSGTTITFTSAPPSGTNNIYVIHLGPAVATAQPPAEIADATTFASNVSVQGSFTSPGIDDNADATAITIDGSEAVLVGKTSNTFSQQGVVLRANNDSQITRDGGNPFSLNRTSSDGNILTLYKDGSTVGSIGVGQSDDLYIGTDDTGLLTGSNDALCPWNPSTNAGRDSAIDLGTDVLRFKDAYLSGGIYLGGAVAANKLDDYEEGTWTPSLYAVTGGAITVSATSTGFYTKVGRLVHVSFAIDSFAVSGGTGGATINISGLPFTTQGSGLDSNGSVLGSYNITWSRTDFVALRTYDVSTLGFLISNNGGPWIWETVSSFTGSNKYVNGTITYMTTA